MEENMQTQVHGSLSQDSIETHVKVSGASIGMINLRHLVLPEIPQKKHHK